MGLVIRVISPIHGPLYMRVPRLLTAKWVPAHHCDSAAHEARDELGPLTPGSIGSTLRRVDMGLTFASSTASCSYSEGEKGADSSTSPRAL